MQVTWHGAEQAGWHVLDVNAESPWDLASARQWAETRLATLGEDHRIDALLVVGELLDNAFLHAGGPRQLRLHHTEDPCRVTVAVADTHPGDPRPRNPHGARGRGLVLVDRVCREWGVSHHDDGKLVWGSIDCEAPAA